MPGKAAPITEPGKKPGSPAGTPGPAAPAADPRPLSLLAGDLYGDGYKGAPARPASGGEEDETPPDDGEPGTPGPGDGEEGAPEGEQAPDGGAGDEGGEEGEPISSLADLLAHFELTQEWADSLTVPVKVDGETSQATLKDLVASYQMKEASEKRFNEAKEKARAVSQEAAAQRDVIQGQFAVAAELFRAAEAELKRDSDGVDWPKLRSEDPAEYSAKRAEVTERRERIEELKRGAAEKYRQTLEKDRAQKMDALRAQVQVERAALLLKLPEWNDEKVAGADKAKLISYLTGLGFNRDDVLGLYDHNMILIARKAMLHDEALAASGPAKKKFFRVPRVLSPGSPKPREQARNERLGKLVTAHKRTGTIDSALGVLHARRKT